MIPIGGLLLVIIAEPPNRIELLNRRLLHTSRDGKSICRATSIDSIAVYRTRGRYATGTAARGQLGENPGDGRELKFLGVIAGRIPPRPSPPHFRIAPA